MKMDMTPQERRTVARELADILSNDDLLRDEVYALLDIDHERLSRVLSDKVRTLSVTVRDLKTKSKNLDKKIEKVKRALED